MEKCVLPRSDPTHVDHVIVRNGYVVPHPLSKRALGLADVGQDFSFQDEFARGRQLDVDGPATAHGEGFAREAAGKIQLARAGRDRGGPRNIDGGGGTEDHSNLKGTIGALGNLLNAEKFDYQTSEDVRDELTAMLGDIEPDNTYAGNKPLQAVNGADDSASVIDIPMYQTDAVVRRATALQLTPEAQRSSGERE